MNKTKHHKNMVYITVEGGLIQNIACDNPKVEVVVVDFDIEGMPEDHLTRSGRERARISHWKGSIVRKVPRTCIRWLKGIRSYYLEGA